jgi:hypothetical protein
MEKNQRFALSDIAINFFKKYAEFLHMVGFYA